MRAGTEGHQAEGRQAEGQQSVAVIGGGVMGGDIAAIFATGGCVVHVMSPSRHTRDSLPGRIESAITAMAGQSADTADTVGIVARRVIAHESYDDIPWDSIDLVIESVSEDLALKHEVFRQLERRVSPSTILASNTSTFAIGGLASVLEHRHRLMGIHFFMPAHLVPLVEVISSEHTDETLVANVTNWLQSLGKKPIWVRKDVPGFVGNRLQHAMMREALYLMEEGVATAEEIDIAVRFGFGFRFIACGPMMQKEMSGWDTNRFAGTALYPHLHDEKVYPPGIEKMVIAGRTGMKTLHGIWTWTDESAAQAKAAIAKRLRAALALLDDNDAGRQGQ